MIRATFHKGLSTNTSGNCPGFPEGSCVRPARTSTELDNQSPQGGAPAARAPRALPSLAAFRGGLPPLNLPAAITRRTPRKGMGPMGDRERSAASGRSGKAGSRSRPFMATALAGTVPGAFPGVVPAQSARCDGSGCQGTDLAERVATPSPEAGDHVVHPHEMVQRLQICYLCSSHTQYLATLGIASRLNGSLSDAIRGWNRVTERILRKFRMVRCC